MCLENSRLKIPRYSSDIPKKIPYLLIGGGTASFSAFRAIKSRDPTAKVIIIKIIYLEFMGYNIEELTAEWCWRKYIKFRW